MNSASLLRFSARFLSLVLHPLLLPTYAFALIMWSSPYTFGDAHSALFRRNMVVVFSNTFCFPALTLLIMKQVGLIKSLHMPEGRERIIPMMSTMVFYVFAFMVFRKGLLAPPILSTILLGATLTVMLCFFVNIFTKVSIHAAGMGSLVALLIFYAGSADFSLIPWIMLAIFLAGLVGAARLYLGAHRNGQLYYGYFVGFFCQAAAFAFTMARP